MCLCTRAYVCIAVRKKMLSFLRTHVCANECMCIFVRSNIDNELFLGSMIGCLYTNAEEDERKIKSLEHRIRNGSIISLKENIPLVRISLTVT